MLCLPPEETTKYKSSDITKVLEMAPKTLYFKA